MAIELSENVLLTVAGVIFVPIFVFLIKMIMEVANIRTKLDTFQAHIEEAKDYVRRLSNTDYEIRWIKERLEDIEQDLKYLFSSSRHDDSVDTYGSRRRFKGSNNKDEK